MIAHCLDVELHSLVPFLINGFVFGPACRCRSAFEITAPVSETSGRLADLAVRISRPWLRSSGPMSRKLRAVTLHQALSCQNKRVTRRPLRHAERDAAGTASLHFAAARRAVLLPALGTVVEAVA